MTKNLLFKLKELPKNWVFWALILITGTAILMRIIPSLIYTAWGCDFGIYYGITNTVVESKEFFPQYFGWGSSYNEFPVLYSIVAFTHWITGIDIIVLMPKIVPTIGAFTVFIFYFIVKELTENKKIAVLSALFLSVSPFHVYQLSHAAPLVIGHFFMMLSLFFFIKFRKKTIYIIPLIIMTTVLIMSHHFTTYIYIISLVSIVFFENLYVKEWTITLKKDVVYILITSGLTFCYWAFIAKTVFESFMMRGFKIGHITLHPLLIIVIFYTIIFCSFFLIKYIRKLHLIKERKDSSVKSSLYKFSSAFFVCLLLMTIFTFITIPGHKLSFNAISIIYSIPLILIFSFVVAGFRYTRFIKNGLFIRGWLIGIVLSLAFSVLTNSRVILPDRHPEYISIPISMIAVLGIGIIFSDPEFKVLFTKLKDKKDLITTYFSKKVKISYKKRILASTIVVGLVVTNGLSVYPSFFTIGPDESITKEDIDTINWMFKNLDINTTVIASDHRLERYAEAMPYNFTTTGKISDIDKAYNLWASENLEEYYDELNGTNRNYSRITHVLIDTNMKYNKVHIGEKFEPQIMTNETWTGGYDKFSYPPFNIIYRNESEKRNPITDEAISWTEVYEVNWTYLETIL